ncbi:MAG: HRDC domain-containing protein [Bacteroidaceae bacterium]|nr:HRDC domain-containing protein [Bacteroidaceae bacterium]
MEIKIFDISSRGSDEELEKMNKFMRGHKILDIDRQFYTSSDNIGHWSILVTYLPTVNPNVERKEKVDYKSVLSEEDFEKFTRLRAIRKQLAADDAVPAYSVFSDSELAQIAQLPQVLIGEIKRISGIGEKRVEKYGKLLCAAYNNEDEASRVSD